MIANISTWKEFNCYDKKINRYNNAVNSLNTLILNWMALNEVEKKKRDNLDMLINGAEQIINEE